MAELGKIRAEIARLKAQEARQNKLGSAKSELRELKYGKYFKPGRKVASWVGKGAKKAYKSAKNYKAPAGNESMGGFDMGGFGSGDILGGGDGPLAGIGNGFGGVQMGNPFGEPTRRSSPRKRKRVARRRPRRRVRYTWVRRRI